MRAAIYFTPPADAEATRLAASWLGRDAFTGAATRVPDGRIDPLVSDPARYGFHATIKAPFRLADGATLDAVGARLAAFCASRTAVSIDRLVLARTGGFLALVPEPQSAELSDFAGQVVAEFEAFRARLDATEIARRRPERLSERQRRYLAEWGYPYVFDEFRFHMTLTNQLAEPELSAVEAELAERFASVDGRALPIDGLALFVEPASGNPFRLHSHHPLACA